MPVFCRCRSRDDSMVFGIGSQADMLIFSEAKYDMLRQHMVKGKEHLSEGSSGPETDTHSMDFVGALGPCSGQVLGGIADRGGCCRFRRGRTQETTKR